MKLFLECCVIALLFSLSVYADKEVIIDTDKKAQDILLNKTYKCEWQDSYFSGTDEYTYKLVSLDHVSANVVNSTCQGTALYKGKFINNQLHGSVTGYKPSCGNVSLIKNFYQKSDGSHYFTGFYETNNYKDKGVFRCKAP